MKGIFVWGNVKDVGGGVVGGLVDDIEWKVLEDCVMRVVVECGKSCVGYGLRR